jgi:hypothetical protein
MPPPEVRVKSKKESDLSGCAVVLHQHDKPAGKTRFSPDTSRFSDLLFPAGIPEASAIMVLFKS